MVSERDRGRDRGHDFEDEDVDLLEVDVTRMEADRMPLRKALDNTYIMDTVITSPRSAERNLVDMSGHSYLSLTLLLHVALLRTIHAISLLFLDLPQLY